MDLKSNVDHADLDIEFYMGRLKNDAQVIAEVSKLRQARRELKEFENDFDSHMPSHYKLKEFRQLARNIIEGGVDHKARGGRSDKRTDFEEERLR